MATTVARRLVDAPPVTAARFGLSTVAQVRDDADEHWANGVEWQSFACLPLGVTMDGCISGEVHPPKVPLGCPAIQQADAVTVYAYDLRSAGGRSGDEAARWAADALAAGEWAALEAYFGAMLSAVPGFAAATPAQALGHVEAEVGFLGQQGAIYLDRMSATVLAAEALIVRDGARLTTVLGTPVSVGSYSPASTAGTVTVLGSGAPFVYRSPVFTSEAFDLSVNDWSVIAERTFLVGYDCDAAVATAPIPGVTP